jgi:hypothetical protein
MLTKNREPGQILIFKDKSGPGMGMAARLGKFAGAEHFKIVTAADPSTLRQMLENHAIRAVVIDVGREIGDTLAALRILEGFPTIPLFVFNGFMLPRIEEKAREYCHYYSENQNQLDEFMSVVLASMHRKQAAIIQGISLSQFLQLMNIEKWSGRVTITAETGQGVLLLQDGRLISAAAGERTGPEAWEEMAAWEKIVVEIFADPLPAGMPGEKSSGAAKRVEKSRPSFPDQEADRSGGGNIESLQLVHENTKVVLNLKRLNLAVAEIRDILSPSLLRTDIFLAYNGRSLAGWNSHPLACSQFAAITQSLKSSLQISRFPALGAYYLLDLEADQLLFIVLKGELQWGFLLKETKERLGLLLNIVLPKALAILDDAVAVRHIG